MTALHALRRIVVGGKWFWIALLAYLAVGAWLMFHVDLLVLDSMSRAAHAFFVWHNDPAKLANIGFAWPPLLTLPLLTMTWWSPLGSTGYAAVVVSASMAAVAVALARHEWRRHGAATWLAITAILALAVNPMYVFYASNGMSEASAIALPALALAASLRHFETRSTESLGLASLAAAAGLMSRYELGVIVILVMMAGVVAIPTGTRSAVRIRAVLLFTAAPAVGSVVVWMFFNWTIQGSPTWFLSKGNQLGTVTGTATTVGDSSKEVGTWLAVQQALLAQLSFSPLAIALGIWMLAMAVALWRHQRRGEAWQLVVVSGFLLYNVATNLVIIIGAHNAWFAQPRFNMRAMALAPIAFVWVAWKYGALDIRTARGRLRRAATPIAVGLMLISIPASTWMMWSGSILPSFGEKAFLMAFSGEDLRGREIKGITVGCTGARQMAAWIEEHVDESQAIIADDSSLYAVMMFSSRPDVFLDRVDGGESYFLHAIELPPPSVRYILATDFDECAGVGDDLLSAELPDMYTDGSYPALDTKLGTIAHREHGLVLRELPPRTTVPETDYVKP